MSRLFFRSILAASGVVATLSLDASAAGLDVRRAVVRRTENAEAGAARSHGLEGSLDLDKAIKHREDLTKHGMTRRVVDYKKHKGWSCQLGEASADAYAVSDIVVEECWARCDADLDCGCVEYQQAEDVDSSSTCTLKKRMECSPSKCNKSESNDVYVQKAIWSRDPWRYARKLGKECKHGVGQTLAVDSAEELPSGLSFETCREKCATDADCTCVSWHRGAGTCKTFKNCDMHECHASATYDTYIQEAVLNGYDQRYNGSQWQV
jgi:hypothetical protein